jgi:hypothetical protein
MIDCFIVAEMAELDEDLSLSPFTLDDQIDDFLKKDDLEKAMAAANLPTLVTPRASFVAH